MIHPLEWQIATLKDVRVETKKAKTFTFSLPQWVPHRAGQHYDIRLTAPDGYQAERSYSIASEPERTGEIDLTVELIEDGEVSTFMHDVLTLGDQLEMRGPIGGYFIWEVEIGGPLLLVAGGSGIVPLMSMIRHRSAVRSSVPTRLLYSARTPDEIIYAKELESLSKKQDGLEVIYTLTRSQAPGWQGYAHRIDREMLAEVIAPFGKSAQTYICGPTLLVESAANHLVDLGLSTRSIRTERFGPTGGNSSGGV